MLLVVDLADYLNALFVRCRHIFLGNERRAFMVKAKKSSRNLRFRALAIFGDFSHPSLCRVLGSIAHTSDISCITVRKGLVYLSFPFRPM